MKIVVTGSEGGIGRFIVDEIKRQRPRDEIVRVTRNLNYANTPGVEIGDLRHHSFVARLVSNADIVIHTAAWSYDRLDMGVLPLDVMCNDLECTTSLLEAIAERTTFNGGGHVVFLSSGTVYEAADTPIPTERDDTRMPRSPIGIAKAFSEAAIRAWEKQTGGVYTIWRLFNVVTPYEQHDQPGHIQTDLYRRIFVERAPDLQLFGDRSRCFTWVGDVAKAIVRYLDDGRAWCETFNLGAIESMNAMELADTMIHVGHEMGVLPADYDPKLSVVESVAGDLPSCMPSIDKARITLDWVPQTSALSCVRQFVQGKLAEASKEAS